MKVADFYKVVIAVVGFSFTGFAQNAMADPTTVQFTNEELNAAFVLIRPELNQIVVNGRTGTYTPSPALKFFGITDQTFQIDFSGIITLADIEFNQLKAKTPQIQFNNNDLQLTIPLNDQVAVVRSDLGTISIQGASLTANIGWETEDSGVQNLVVESVSFSGNMTGTGVLNPPFILNGVKKLMVKYLSQELSTLLSGSVVQDSVQNGLLQWAKFYTGTVYQDVVPSSVEFFKNGAKSGIQFKVE
jgi:hypothetical protein